MTRAIGIILSSLVITTCGAASLCAQEASGGQSNHDIAQEILTASDYPIWVPPEKDKELSGDELKTRYRQAEWVIKRDYAQDLGIAGSENDLETAGKWRFGQWYRLEMRNAALGNVRGPVRSPNVTYILNTKPQEILRQCDWESARPLIEGIAARYKETKNKWEKKTILSDMAQTISTIAFNRPDYDTSQEVRIEMDGEKLHITYGTRMSEGRGAMKPQRIQLWLGKEAGDTAFKQESLNAEGGVKGEYSCARQVPEKGRPRSE